MMIAGRGRTAPRGTALSNRPIMGRHNLRGGITSMATLTLALGACVSRMTAGERRLAERLEPTLADDLPSKHLPQDRALLTYICIWLKS